MNNDATSPAGDAPHPDFFIVGFSRSGTTLLATLLNRHTQICVPPETRFCDGVLPYGRPDTASRDHDFITERVFSYWRTPDLDIGREVFEQRFRADESSYKNAFAVLLDLYRQRAGKAKIGEKSPVHLLHIPMIVEWFPRARILCLVRDGRDVVESISTAAFSHGNRLRHAAEWAWQARWLHKLEQEYAESIHTVRFEALLQDTRSVLDDLCGFIGVEYEEGMLDSGASSDVVPEWELAWKRQAMDEVDVSKIAQWKNRPPRPLLDALMWQVMGEQLVDRGYEAPRPVSAAKRVIAWITSWPFTGHCYELVRRLSAWLKEFLYRSHIRRVW